MNYPGRDLFMVGSIIMMDDNPQLIVDIIINNP
jgi:hypothetical protein